jgi:hypothetical protein
MRTASRGIITAVVLVLTMTVSGPAQAAKEPGLKALADRAMLGKLTAVDRSYLDRHPEIAGILIDGTKTEIGEVPMSETQTAEVFGDVVAAATTCAATDRYQIFKSLLGSIIFRYHSYVAWCWSGTTTTVSKHYPYLDMIQNVVVNKGVTVQEVRKSNSATYTTHHQNYIQLCTLGKSLGSICYDNVYPTNWVTVSNKTGSTFKYSN